MVSTNQIYCLKIHATFMIKTFVINTKFYFLLDTKVVKIGVHAKVLNQAIIKLATIYLTCTTN